MQNQTKLSSTVVSDIKGKGEIQNTIKHELNCFELKIKGVGICEGIFMSKEYPLPRNPLDIFAFCFNVIWGEENDIFQEFNEI